MKFVTSYLAEMEDKDQGEKWNSITVVEVLMMAVHDGEC